MTNRVIISHPEDAGLCLCHADMRLIAYLSMPGESFLSLPKVSPFAHYTRSNCAGAFEENARSSNISKYGGMCRTLLT